MDNELQKRLTAFVQALEMVGLRTGGMEAACHHSAVEVNDWHAIQKAMLDADEVVGTPTDTSACQANNSSIAVAVEGNPREEARQ